MMTREILRRRPQIVNCMALEDTKNTKKEEVHKEI
jgi:hypothetical protein